MARYRMFTVSTPDRALILKISAPDEYNARQEIKRFAWDFFGISILNLKTLIVTSSPKRK